MDVNVPSALEERMRKACTHSSTSDVQLAGPETPSGRAAGDSEHWDFPYKSNEKSLNEFGKQDFRGGHFSYSSYASTPRKMVLFSPAQSWCPETGKALSSNSVPKLPAVDIAALQSEFEEAVQQNEALRQEVWSLQYDNAVLLTQLDEQVACLSALAFDTERYKTKLEHEHISVPQSTYDEVRTASRIPRSSVRSGISLPNDLISSVQLTDDERASFNSIHNLVTTINELQVRLREAHLRRTSVADCRLAELQELVTNIEAQLQEAQQSRTNLQKRFEEDLLTMTRKRDAALGRLSLLEIECTNLKKELTTVKAQEALEIKKLDLQDMERKMESLEDLLEKQSKEMASLCMEKNSLLASLLVAEKENEYYSMAWKREQKQNDDLREERERLTEELNTLRAARTALETDVMLLKGKQGLAERMGEANEAEILQWKKRIADLQQQHKDEISFWEKTVQDGIARLNELELNHEESQACVKSLQTLLQEKEKTVNELSAHTEQELATLNGRLKHSQSLLDEEIASHAATQRHVTDLAIALKNQKEERRSLVDRLEVFEKQAVVLKERHPALNFEVLEDEIQHYEKREQTLLADLCSVKEDNQKIALALKSAKDMCKELQETINQLQCQMEQKEQNVLELGKKIQESIASANALQQRIETLEEQLHNSETLARTTAHKLTEAETECVQLRKQLEDALHQHQRYVELHDQEKKDLVYRAEIARIDMENAQQAHRLEVQAHSNDIQRYDQLKEKLKELQDDYSKVVEQEKQKCSALREQVVTSEARVADVTCKLQYSEEEKDQIKNENTSLHELLRNKLDSLELQDVDSVKVQLASHLRREDTLKRNLTSARTEVEQLKYEVTSLRENLCQLRKKSQEDSETLIQLEKELRDARETDNSGSRISSADEELSLLQLRFTRLKADYEYQQERRRNAEKELNDLLTEMEPSRRKEAMLHGELLNLKSSLNDAELDAKLYREKYLDVIRNRDTDIEKLKHELTTKINVLEAEKAMWLQNEHTFTQERENITKALEKETESNQQLRITLEQHSRRFQSLETEIQKYKSLADTLQEQNNKAANEGPEICRRYQLQLSNAQRVLQQTKQEKVALRSELANLQRSHQEQLSLSATLNDQLTRLNHQLSRKNSQNSKNVETHQLEQLDEQHLIEEVVRLGVISAVLLFTLTANVPSSPSSVLESLPCFTSPNTPEHGAPTSMLLMSAYDATFLSSLASGPKTTQSGWTERPSQESSHDLPRSSNDSLVPPHSPAVHSMQSAPQKPIPIISSEDRDICLTDQQAETSFTSSPSYTLTDSTTILTPHQQGIPSQYAEASESSSFSPLLITLQTQHPASGSGIMESPTINSSPPMRDTHKDAIDNHTPDGGGSPSSMVQDSRMVEIFRSQDVAL